MEIKEVDIIKLVRSANDLVIQLEGNPNDKIIIDGFFIGTTPLLKISLEKSKQIIDLKD